MTIITEVRTVRHGAIAFSSRRVLTRLEDLRNPLLEESSAA
jgi:hypothetical protein